MNQKKKIKTEIIHITRAEPDTFWNIFKYLISFGRFGSVFRPKIELMKRHTTIDHVNCRCSTVSIIKK